MSEFSHNCLRRVAEWFDETTFERGLRYAMEGRVTVDHWDWPVVARVRGTETYIVQVNYVAASEAFDARCSCPVKVDCKHAVATALIALRGGEEAIGSRVASYREREVSDWLLRLGSSLDRGEPGPQRVGFTLLSDARRQVSQLALLRTRLLKRGGLSRGTHFARMERTPRWATREEKQLCHLVMAAAGQSSMDAELGVEGIEVEVFRRIAAAEQLFLDDTQSPPLRMGEEREARLVWVPEGEDGVRLGLSGDLFLVPASETLYICEETHTIGRLRTGLGSDTVRRLVAGPVVPLSLIATAERSLRSALSSTEAEALFPPRQEDVPPTPRLVVSLSGGGKHPVLRVRAFANYREGSYPLVQGALAQSAAARDLVLEREFQAEVAGLEDLDAGLLPPKKLLERVQELVEERVPSLRLGGWEVELDGDFPVEAPRTDVAFTESLEPVQANRLWFRYGLGVLIDGRRVDLLPLLLEALKDGRLVFEDGTFSPAQPHGLTLKLATGESVFVSRDRIASWVRPLLELHLAGLNRKAQLWLPAIAAAQLASRDGWEGGGEFSDSEAVRVAVGHLKSLLDAGDRAAGPGFVGELRGYQRRGHAWLRHLHEAGYGGLLCDDMGLGKTVQVLAFLDGLRETGALAGEGRALVVAPRSVVGNWLREAERFAPLLRSRVHLGAQRSSSPSAFSDTDLVITSYQTLLRDLKLFASQTWVTVVFDEAHALKNPQTKLRKGVADLVSHSRFCVSGTPIENHLEELWSQMDLVMPGLLGTRASFRLVYRSPIEKYGVAEVLHRLRDRIQPFLMRRTKGEVDVELPKKTVVIERVPLPTVQRDLYETLRLALDQQVKQALEERGVNHYSMQVLEALLRLRQCCCDPRLLKFPQAEAVRTSAKLERLLSMLEELEDSGRRVLVFSQFTSMLDLIEQACEDKGIGTLKLTGSTTRREEVIDAFQHGHSPVFLVSLKAGGVGLNLTAADTVIHYDPWWNPAAEEQATDRVHRIGQTRSVLVYKLVAEETLEEQICVLQERKQKLTDSALHAGGFAHLGAKDLHRLLEEL